MLLAVLGCGDGSREADCLSFVDGGMFSSEEEREAALEAMPCRGQDRGRYYREDGNSTLYYCYEAHSVAHPIDGDPSDDLPDDVCDPRFSSGRRCWVPLGPPNPTTVVCWCPGDRVGEPGGIQFCEESIEP